MLTNVYEHDGINQWTFHIIEKSDLSPLAKTAYLGKAQLVFH